MIAIIIAEMEKVDKLNISGNEKKEKVLEKCKKELGEYYVYNIHLIRSTIDFITNISKNNFTTSINNNKHYS